MENGENESGALEGNGVSKEIVEIRERLDDPNYLPTHEDIKSVFNSGATLQDGSNDPRYDWDTFRNNREKPVFELINKEYVEAMANYLSERASELKKDGEPLVILEVGAGNGRLTHFLEEKLKAMNPDRFIIQATDDNSWNLKPDFPVEKISNSEALAKYHPDIVISSWMPFDVDFTEDFRKSDSVKEYILIGEDVGCTGEQWKTWGSPTSEMFENDLEKSIPPYKQDGFKKVNLDDLSEFNLSKLSDPRFLDSSTDSTTSFRRI